MLTPTAPSERYRILDVLRGFALLGVILANMASHSGLFFLAPAQVDSLDFLGIDQLITWLLHFLVDGKFYSLFSLLFGIGFALQLRRSEDAGTNFRGRYSRRLLILFIFGLLHAVLFYVGDILTVYALTGAFLLLFRNASDKTLIRTAIVLMILPLLQYTLFWIPAIYTGAGTETARPPFFDQLVLVYQTGTIPEIITNNIGGLIFGRYPDLLFTGRFFRVLAMFLIGFYVARHLLLSPGEQNRAFLGKVILWGALVGIPCNIVLAFMMETNAYYTIKPAGILEPLAYAFGVPGLCLSYAAAIVRLYELPTWQNRLNLFAPVGQMALTNYLMQSVLCCLIFMSYGFGLFGQVGSAILMIIALGIYTFQILFSKWWLRRYRFGPAEWLWRSLTYRKWQPMRLAPVQTAAQIIQ